MRTRKTEKVKYTKAGWLNTASLVRQPGWPITYAWQDNPPSEIAYMKEQSFTQETMIDEEPVGGNDRPERSCAHTKFTARNTGGEYTIVRPSASTMERYPDYLTMTGYPYKLPRNWNFLYSELPSLPDIFPEWLAANDIAGSAFGGLPFLGELRKTVQMVKQPLSFLKGLKVPNGQRAAPLGYILDKYGFGRASNAWLVKKYGWDPLIGDLQKFSHLVYNMSEHYQRYLDGDQIWTKVDEKRFLGELEDEVRTSTTTTETLQTRRTSHHARLTFEYRVKPAAQTGHVLSYANYCARRFGLGLDSVAAASWELMPYSFVADWFIPVGSKLNGLSHSPCFAEFRKQSYHYTLRQEVDVSDGVKSNAAYGRQSAPRDPQTRLQIRNIAYYRNWMGYCPDPALLKNGLSTSRTITALSLLAQQLMYTIPKKR